MSRVAIQAEGLGKSYHRGALQESTLLRDHLSRMLKSPLSVLRRAKDETFWALKDVSLEVREGEVLGIIGRNGAGKTTLLKILSRITRPTTGWAEIHGRVGSLLEVGTGFHPELTGRENIFVNGAILGMKKAEIARKFDEIVAFAEVERFIDTPVKHYSSGMYVRLAFAVAAHLEPEILLVDEVLAVGDAQFQKKCLGRMGDVAREGRTILFVSHNMGAINRVCSRCLWIEAGGVKAHGTASAVVASYLSEGLEAAAERHWDRKDAPGGDGVSLQSARICQPAGHTCTAVDIRLEFEIELKVEIEKEAMEELGINIQIVAADGQIVYHSTSRYSEHDGIRDGLQLSTCTLPPYALNAGVYSLTVGADCPHRDLLFLHENTVNWSVEATCPTMGRYPTDAWKGVLGPGLGRWSTTSAETNSRD